MERWRMDELMALRREAGYVRREAEREGDAGFAAWLLGLEARLLVRAVEYARECAGVAA